MKKITILYLSSLIFILISCSDFLEVDPKGVLSEENLITPENVEGFVTATYAALGNDHYDTPFSLWPYGNVRSDDAYKGGGGTNDIQTFHFFEISSNIRTDHDELNRIWYDFYVGISRANKAINALNQIDEADFSNKESRLAEMYFIRGHFYFMLKILFRNIPYVTNETSIEEYGSISNTDLTDQELWEAIASDFEYAAAHLPANQMQIGRVNKYGAYGYLAKVRLYQAYEQDANYSVTQINQQTLQKVIDATDEVLGAYSLETDFAYNFLPESYENGSESVFAIQYSDGDGTLYGRLNFGDVLSTPQGLGCCDFHKPSQNLVNAYKTSADGLPLFDTYNNSDLDYNQLNNYTVDPRLYHTVAIPGLPYKYNSDYIYVESWNRSPSTYGYYASLKENVAPDCGCFVNIDPFYGNSKNRIVIRYADILLMRAEAFIELGQESQAISLINAVRSRAAASTTLTGTYTSNNMMATYQDGVNCTWSQDFARQALRWERRLEFAMEGSRFFDLVRWGVASDVLNTYYSEEQIRRPYYAEANFDAHKEEYCPIPLAQINFSQGLYQQNAGY